MIYTPPIVDGKEVWVPVVAKSRDWLVGYINGMNFTQEVISALFEEMEIEFDFSAINGLGVDSTRFNDILPNDARMSKLSKKEFKEFVESMNSEMNNKLEMSDNPDDGDIEVDDRFLIIECPCNLGFYSFNTEKDIPHESLNCQICGRPLIQYTNVDDCEFEYDGEEDEN